MSITFPPPLSAKFPKSFAYDTVKDRIPRILAKVVDTCHRNVNIINEKYGEEGREDALDVVAKLSKLRSEIMTDKPLMMLDDSLPDVHVWNARRKEYCDANSREPTWFTAPWLYVECFMYRRIAGVLSSSKFMKEFDPFSEQKEQSLRQSMSGVATLAHFFNRVVETLQKDNLEAVKQRFIDFMEVSLWGNKCDLSISGGDDNHQASSDLHANMEAFRRRLLVNHSSLMWGRLMEVRGRRDQVRVDIVLDNSGYELFTDLVLCDFLLTFDLAHHVTLHPKLLPWFVSDVTPRDFRWTLDHLASSTSDVVAELARRWKQHVEKGRMSLVEEEELLVFYSLPDPYHRMREAAPALHQRLSSSDLVFFKGDLNYRKLVSDLDWPHETPFELALRGFEPAPLCSLRTLKANVVVGLRPGQVAEAQAEDKDWMVTGNFAVVQCSP